MGAERLELPEITASLPEHSLTMSSRKRGAPKQKGGVGGGVAAMRLVAVVAVAVVVVVVAVPAAKGPPSPPWPSAPG